MFNYFYEFQQSTRQSCVYVIESHLKYFHKNSKLFSKICPILTFKGISSLSKSWLILKYPENSFDISTCFPIT